MLVFWQLEVCLTAVVHDFFCRYVRIMRVLLFLLFDSDYQVEGSMLTQKRWMES